MRPPTGSTKPVESPPGPDDAAARERPKVEGIEIEDAAAFGGGGEVDLETAVEAKAFDDIGADAAANAVRGFEYLERYAALRQPPGTAQPGQSGPDDQHVRVVGHRIQWFGRK